MPNIDVDIDDDVYNHQQQRNRSQQQQQYEHTREVPAYRTSVGYTPQQQQQQQQHPQQLPPRPSYKPERQIPPRGSSSGTLSTSNSFSNGSSTTHNVAPPQAQHRTHAHTNIDDDDDDDDAFPIEHETDSERFNSNDYQQSLALSSSFNVEQMIQMRASSGTFRDSLAIGQRPTEMGSALMRMDDAYARTPNHNNNSSGNIHGGNLSTSGSFSLQTPGHGGTTADGLTPLLQAARAGDLVLLNALIIQPGTDILRRDPVFGQTALHFAIRGGHLGVVQALLMPQIAGSVVNIADSRRNTALHLAAAKSRRMTKQLLDAGADVNFLNMRNQTPLGVHLLTVTRDDPTLTEILLQHRANPNAPVDKSTTLHVALDKGLFQIASRLVRHGARLDLKDEAGKMVFDKVDANILKMLLSKVANQPVWVKDTERLNCMACNKKFGAVGARRHHCRVCGRLLCSACASCHVKSSELPFKVRKQRGSNKKPETGSKRVRVCATCKDVVAEHAAANAGAPPGRSSSRTSSRR